MSANPAIPADDHPQRWRMLRLLATAELLGMSLWFAASAVSGQLGERWSLDTSQTAWLTSIVQLGFVAGTATAAILNLADIVPARALFPIAAVLGALCNAAVAAVDGYSSALGLRFLTGFFLAGVYPPAMKMISTWFFERRGLAIGTIVGALTAGKALPYAVRALPETGTTAVMLSASGGALVAAAIVAVFYRDGPYRFPSRPFSLVLVGTVVRQRPWRLSTGGYLGHMFELYAFWTWIPAFVAASIAARTPGGSSPDAVVAWIAFATIAIGALGCVWGGQYADRAGREKLVTLAMVVSGACCIAAAILFGAPLGVLVPMLLVWGIFVIADSAQFSALVTESVPQHAVGTALTLQTSLGFLLTMVTIQIVPVAAAEFGWRFAFPVLALGPVAGIMCIRALRILKQSTVTS